VVCGAALRGKALLRSEARPGDRIYVSGELGGAAYRLENNKRDRRFEPRLALGRFLRKLGATAAMDLSDGLSLDLARLCEASRVSADITALPVFRDASLEQALHGGEDYELLFTMPPRRHPPDRFLGVRLSYIGVIQKGRIGAVFVDGKRLQTLGFDHFR
jgi:thiamine-monophosphate kinase